MKLTELREATTSKIDIVKQTNNLFVAKSTINSRVITFTAVTEDLLAWDVEFSEGETSRTFATTGSRGEFGVLAMVMDCIEMLISIYAPATVRMTADTSDNRPSIYEKILKRRMQKGYNLEKLALHSDVIFILVRNDQYSN